MKRFPAIDMKATGQNIKELRISRGYKMKTLVQYLGLTDSTAAYKWERGATLPSIDHLFALAKLFEVPIESILISYSDE